MAAFAFTTPPSTAALAAQLADPACGGYAAFEGWVRDHNEGAAVRRLEYEAFETLALREGERILGEAIARFGVGTPRCVHRLGELAVGELAVWVGVARRIATKPSAPAATSSTRSSSACRSGRRSTTSTATRAG